MDKFPRDDREELLFEDDSSLHNSLKAIDDVIKEPVDGAHRNHEAIFSEVKNNILAYLKELEPMHPSDRITKRIEKFNQMGVWK
jgi:acetyl-CoA carboxylase carboxyl transferase subunit alpha